MRPRLLVEKSKCREVSKTRSRLSKNPHFNIMNIGSNSTFSNTIQSFKKSSVKYIINKIGLYIHELKEKFNM